MKFGVSNAPPPEKDQINLGTARRWIALGNPQKALSVVERLLVANSENPDFWSTAINLHRDLMNFSNAVYLCETAIEKFPDTPIFFDQKMSLLLSTGNLISAVTALKGMETERPDYEIKLKVRLRQIDAARHDLERHRDETGRLPSSLADAEFEVLEAEGENEKAYHLARFRYRNDPENPHLAARILRYAANISAEESDFALRSVIPPVLHDHPSISFVRARMARDGGDTALYVHLLLAHARQARSIVNHVRQLCNGAGAAGFGTKTSKIFIDALNDIMSEADHRFSDFYVSVLKMHISFSRSDWKELLRLAQRACTASPMDMTLLALKARAEFEMERFESAMISIERLLRENPTNADALNLKIAILLLKDGECDAVSFILDQLDRSHLQLDATTAHLLIFNGHAQELHSVLERNIQYASGARRRWLSNLRSQLLGQQRHEKTKAVTSRQSDRLSAQDLASLEVGTTGSIQPNSKPSINAWTAWSLQGRSFFRRKYWLREASRATYLNKIAEDRWGDEECFKNLAFGNEFFELKKRIALGEPTLLVGTHSGFPNLFTLAPYLDDVTYLLHEAPLQVRRNRRWKYIEASDNRSIVEIARCLRSGGSLYSTPDYPAEIHQSIDFKPVATGKIFGVTCSLVDTIPKFSFAKDVPIYWTQAMWRKDSIFADVRQMSRPYHGEDVDSWCARWAQEYLCLVEDLFRSDPRNQNLNSPMNHFLSWNRTAEISNFEKSSYQRKGIISAINMENVLCRYYRILFRG